MPSSLHSAIHGPKPATCARFQRQLARMPLDLSKLARANLAVHLQECDTCRMIEQAFSRFDGDFDRLLQQGPTRLLYPRAEAELVQLTASQASRLTDGSRTEIPSTSRMPAKLLALWAVEDAVAEALAAQQVPASTPRESSDASEELEQFKSEWPEPAESSSWPSDRVLESPESPAMRILPFPTHETTTSAPQSTSASLSVVPEEQAARTTFTLAVSDHQLIEQVQTAPSPQANQAFQALISRYASSIHADVHARVARATSDDSTVVDDLIQVVRIRAWLRLHRANPLILTATKTFEHYLYAIAHNVLRDYLEEMRKRHSIEESLEALCARIPDQPFLSSEPAADLDDAPVRDLRHSLLATSLATVRRHQPPDRNAAHRAHAEIMQHYALDGRSLEFAAATWVQGSCRDAFMLAKLAGLSQHEIAVKLGIPIGTVGAHISEGRAQFEALYALLLWEEEGATDDEIARRFAGLHWREGGASAAEVARRVAIEMQRMPEYLQRGRELRARFLRRAVKGGGPAADHLVSPR